MWFIYITHYSLVSTKSTIYVMLLLRVFPNLSFSVSRDMLCWFDAGKSNVKKKKHRQQGLLFPLKLKMNHSFKKPRKSKNKTKKA